MLYSRDLLFNFGDGVKTILRCIFYWSQGSYVPIDISLLNHVIYPWIDLAVGLAEEQCHKS